MQLAADGKVWATGSADVKRRWFGFLAHESYHLWDQETFHPGSGPWEEWLSEGLAEFFSRKALLDRGLMDEVAYRREMVVAANKCVIGLQDRPLLTSHTTGDYDNFYTCGLALLFTLDGRLSRTESSADLAEVMRHVYAQAHKRSDRQYTTHAMFEAAVELTRDPLLPGTSDQLLRVGVPRVVEYWEQAFASAGVGVDRVSVEAADLPPRRHMRALAKALGRCDCGQRTRARPVADGLQFDGASQCSAFRHGLVVSSVEGHALEREPARAHMAALRRLHRGRAVRMRTTAGKKLAVRCTQDRLPRYESLLRLP